MFNCFITKNKIGQTLTNLIMTNKTVEQGNVGMFDNSYFDNSFGFVRQFKNGSFQVHVLVHKKVKIRINRT